MQQLFHYNNVTWRSEIGKLKNRLSSDGGERKEECR